MHEHLKSLDAMLEFEHCEVWPAHEYRFREARDRVRAHHHHHHHDLPSKQIVEAVDSGHDTGWQMGAPLPWTSGWPKLRGISLRSALAETLAHVEYLRREGRIMQRIDEHGAIRVTVPDA